MSSITLPPPLEFDRPPVAVRRFTVAEYHKIAKSGVLTAVDRVELLEGWIAPKMIHDVDHALAIENGQVALEALLPAGWRLRVQLPISTKDSEPEPDFAIVRHPRPRRKQVHPLPADLAVVIEVADTTLTADRRIKGRLYARASIPEYWIVNLVDGRVEVYSNPSGPVAAPSFKSRRNYGKRKSVPIVIDGREIARVRVTDLLP